MAVALADKLDQLAGFFSIGAKPSGSGDPYALRRAALGVIRIVRENGLRVPLKKCLEQAATAFEGDAAALANEVFGFITERLRVQLRSEGARHDVLAAVFAAASDDDLVRALARTDAVAALLKTEDGANLLAAYKRAANILRIEDRKDGPHHGPVDDELLQVEAEGNLLSKLAELELSVEPFLIAENFSAAMSSLSQLRNPLDAFFNTVIVNSDDASLRRNRLRLLSAVQFCIDRVADFSQIENEKESKNVLF
jgi:glycyl-tRNA synthetase beta chain